MIIYVLDDGETWTLAEPTSVAITPEQLTRIEDGEKVYNVVPNWSNGLEPDWEEMDADNPDLLMDPVEYAAKHDAEDVFVQAGIAAAEALKEVKRRDYTARIIEAQTKGEE